MASRRVANAGDMGRRGRMERPFLGTDSWILTVAHGCDTNGRFGAKPLVAAVLGGSGPGRFRKSSVGDPWEEDR